MMRWALIEGSSVTNVISSDTQPLISGVWVACGSAGPGWVYVDGVFSDPRAVVVPAPRHITGYAFKMRLTSAERIAIRTAAAASPAVADFMDLADSAQYIDLDLGTTRDGVEALEAATLIGVGRAAVILDTAIVDAERP